MNMNRRRVRADKVLMQHLPANLAWLREYVGVATDINRVIGIGDVRWSSLETKGDHQRYTHAAELLYIARALGVTIDDLLEEPEAFRHNFARIPYEPLAACVPSKADRKPWRDGWYCLLGRHHEAPHIMRPNHLGGSEYA
jgi:hypothetical protein